MKMTNKKKDYLLVTAICLILVIGLILCTIGAIRLWADPYCLDADTGTKYFYRDGYIEVVGVDGYRSIIGNNNTLDFEE